MKRTYQPKKRQTKKAPSVSKKTGGYKTPRQQIEEAKQWKSLLKKSKDCVISKKSFVMTVLHLLVYKSGGVLV